MPITSQSRFVAETFPYTYRNSITGALIPQTTGDLGTYKVGLDSDSTQSTTSFRGNADDDYDVKSGADLRRGLREEYKLRFDTGHEFSTQKRTVTTSHTKAHCTNGRENTTNANRYTYDGPVYAALVTSSRPASNFASNSTLDAWGRALISRTIPTSPEAGLATFLGELREGLPRIVGHSLLNRNNPPPRRKDAGGEYLNWQFGLKPFANDLAKMALAVTSFHAKVEKFRQSSDLVVHKKAHLSETATNGVFAETTPNLKFPRCNATPVNFWNTFGLQAQVLTQTVQNVWFSGAYSYHLAEAHNFLSKMERYEQLANNLLGTRITPEVVWELTPWSWLIDWVSDAGIFFKNLSALSSDSLVLRFGYVMCETRTTWTKTVLAIPPFASDIVAPKAIVTKYELVSKQRRRASPYGFGLNPSAFSGTKWAILGALGMTKGPNTLRSGL